MTDDERLEMLLETALLQVCGTITTRMREPDTETQTRLRDQIRTALFCARVLGKLSRNRVRQAPTMELDVKSLGKAGPK